MFHLFFIFYFYLKMKFSITYPEYLVLKEVIKKKTKKTFEENCYIKLFESIHKFIDNDYINEDKFINDEEKNERNEYLESRGLEFTPNFNILYDIVDENPSDTIVLKTNKYGLVEYCLETENEIKNVAILLPLFGIQWVKIEKKDKNKVAFIYCFKDKRSYLVARKVLAIKP